MVYKFGKMVWCLYLKMQTLFIPVTKNLVFGYFFLNKFTEGFVDSEDLASRLEKAWLSLHVQVCSFSFSSSLLITCQCPFSFLGLLLPSLVPLLWWHSMFEELISVWAWFCPSCGNGQGKRFKHLGCV